MWAVTRLMPATVEDMFVYGAITDPPKPWIKTFYMDNQPTCNLSLFIYLALILLITD